MRPFKQSLAALIIVGEIVMTISNMVAGDIAGSIGWGLLLLTDVRIIGPVIDTFSELEDD